MGITKLLYINRDISYGGSSHLRNALEYIMKPEKTENGLLIGGGNCLFSTPEIVYENMLQTKQLWRKEDGRQAYHYIISLNKGEGDSDVMMDIMERFCKDYLKDDYEYVYAVHTDKAHMHGHVIFNSVSRVNGLKYHYKQGDWQRYIQPITNRLCSEHGLSTIKLEQEFDFKVGDWKAAMREDIDECRECSKSYDEFLQKLEAMGYDVHDGPRNKYLALVPPGKGGDGFQGHGTGHLGEGYSKSDLMEYFRENPKPVREAPVSDGVEQRREKKKKWEIITYTKYRFYMPTKELRRLFIDYKKHRQLQRSYYDRRAFLYKKDVKQLKTTMERQSYLLDHGLTTTQQVQERYRMVKTLFTKANKAYAQVNKEMLQRREEYELYEEYISYKILEEMYVSSNADPELFDYHKKYLQVLKKIENSPYSLEGFESLEGLKKARAQCLDNVKALRAEKNLLSTILAEKKNNPEQKKRFPEV